MKSLIENDILIIPEGTITIKEKEYYENNSFSYIKFPSSLKTIENEAFAYCHNIKEIIFNENLETIKAGAFFENINLEKVIFNDNLKLIEDGAFLSCEKLTHIDIPKKIDTIPTMCFYGCNLKELFIPENIKYIKEQAFVDNQNLKEITILNKECEIENDVFLSCNKLINGFVACGYPIEFGLNDEILYSLLALSTLEKHPDIIKDTVKEYALNNEILLMEKIIKTNNTKALSNLIINNLIKGNIDDYIEKAYKLKENELIALLLQNKQDKEDLFL